MQGHIGVGHALTVVCGFGCSHLGTCCHQLGVAFNHKVCCTGIGLRHVLGHLAHAPLRWNIKLTRVFGQCFVEQCKQGRFTCPIPAHQAHFFPGVQTDRGLVKQNFCAAAQADIFKSDHANNADCVISSTCVSPVLVDRPVNSRVGNAAMKCSNSCPISSTKMPSSFIKAGAS